MSKNQIIYRKNKSGYSKTKIGYLLWPILSAILPIYVLYTVGVLYLYAIGGITSTVHNLLYGSFFDALTTHWVWFGNLVLPQYTYSNWLLAIDTLFLDHFIYSCIAYPLLGIALIWWLITPKFLSGLVLFMASMLTGPSAYVISQLLPFVYSN